MRALSLIVVGLGVLAACSSSGTYSPPDPPAVGAGGAASGPSLQGGTSSGPSLGNGGTSAGASVGNGGAASNPSLSGGVSGGGGSSSSSSSSGACACVSRFAAALSKGYACLGHPGTCPGSATGCGTLDQTLTTCTWGDGAKVTFLSGPSSTSDYNVYGPGGALCFTQTTQGSGAATTVVETFPDGAYTYGQGANGAYLSCPGGAQISVADAESCPGASGISTTPNFCCIATGSGCASQ